VLFNILARLRDSRDLPPRADDAPDEATCLAIFERDRLVAIARHAQGAWGLERVFTSDAG
jgi:hypothetical protein